MKIAKSISDARQWANTFTCGKRWTAISCPHGTPTSIEIVDNGQVVDSVCVCPDCWVLAKWVDKIQ